MMNFKAVFYFGPLKRGAHGGMLNFLDARDVLNLGIDDAMLVLKERRQSAAGNIAIFVERGRQYGAAVLAEPPGIVGSTSEE